MNQNHVDFLDFRCGSQVDFLLYIHQHCSQVGVLGPLLKHVQEAENALAEFAKFLGAYNIR